jgi:hypothetical protein
MKTRTITKVPENLDNEWIPFPGGELEGPRPKAMCAACRDRLQQASNPSNPSNPSNLSNLRPLCFACHQASISRDRALKAAGQLDTASEARFQTTLPFQPVDEVRLARLRAERATARLTAQAGVGRYVDKRRHAQIAARHALERIVVGLRVRNATKPEHDRVMTMAVHAAELQLPEAWLPFVVSR